MEDRRSIKTLITNLSAQRKVGLVIALVLLGAGISDPGFLSDADVSATADPTDSSTDSFEEIEAMLADFETAETSGQPEIPRATAANVPEQGPVGTGMPPLTIPDPREQHVFHNASFPESSLQQTPAGSSPGTSSGDHAQALTLPAPQTTIVNTDHNRRNAPRIRFTGTIVPSP